MSKIAPDITSLKLTKAFRLISRRGRWAHSRALSVGTLPNRQGTTRVGLRIRRTIKGAVRRNRLKRQLRTSFHSSSVTLRPGVDIVVIIHPKSVPARAEDLQRELIELCKRTGATP